MKQDTLLLIKPDAVARGLVGRIIDRLELSGFRIERLKLESLTTAAARRFYAVHAGKPFLDKLVSYMSSGPVIAMWLRRENAVTCLRELIGATDPRQAACGTIRQCFGMDVTKNAVHASDSIESATLELDFFFTSRKRKS